MMTLPGADGIVMEGPKVFGKKFKEKASDGST
jgi:hypothetical protein